MSHNGQHDTWQLYNTTRGRQQPVVNPGAEHAPGCFRYSMVLGVLRSHTCQLSSGGAGQQPSHAPLALSRRWYSEYLGRKVRTIASSSPDASCRLSPNPWKSGKGRCRVAPRLAPHAHWAAIGIALARCIGASPASCAWRCAVPDQVDEDFALDRPCAHERSSPASLAPRTPDHTHSHPL